MNRSSLYYFIDWPTALEYNMYLKLPVLILTAIGKFCFIIFGWCLGIQASWRRADLDEGFPALQPKITSAVDPHPAPAPPPAPAPSPAPSAQLMDDTTKQLHISDIKQGKWKYLSTNIDTSYRWFQFLHGIGSRLDCLSRRYPERTDDHIRWYEDVGCECQDVFRSDIWTKGPRHLLWYSERSGRLLVYYYNVYDCFAEFSGGPRHLKKHWFRRKYPNPVIDWWTLSPSPGLARWRDEKHWAFPIPPRTSCGATWACTMIMEFPS